MKLLLAAGSLCLLIGCGNSAGSGGANGGGGSASSANGGASASGGGSANGGGGPTGSASGGNSGSGGGSGTSSGGGSPTWNAGNPDGSCMAGVPAEGQPVDTSNPTTVVGHGNAASCTFDALKAAIAAGGIVTFDCGGGAVTIPITATIDVPIDRDTVIDGGRRVTLDGQNQVQILNFNSANFQNNESRLTLQHVALVNAKQSGTNAGKIPPAPAPCSQGWDDGQGGALFMRDGNLTVIDCIFTGNNAAPLGPDTGGGAIYVEGSKHGAVIVGSTFQHNAASNAAAVGGLFCAYHIYNSLFSDNTAVGNGANNDDASQCDVINNGQHEIGSGGNGGAIYSDGNSVDMYLCGDKVVNNAAGTGAFGGGLFFTSNNMQGDLSIIDTTMTGNTGGHWTNVATGSTNDAGTAVGTNCHSLTITNSTLQGLP